MPERQGANLLRKREGVAAHHRPERAAAADKLRRAPGTVTGAAGALLLVHLLAGARVLVARLHLVGAGAALGELPVHAARQDVAADLVDPEDGVGELDLAGLAAGEGDDVQLHWASSVAVSTCGSAAASGSASAAPAPLKAPGVGRPSGAARLAASRI